MYVSTHSENKTVSHYIILFSNVQVAITMIFVIFFVYRSNLVERIIKISKYHIKVLIAITQISTKCHSDQIWTALYS